MWETTAPAVAVPFRRQVATHDSPSGAHNPRPPPHSLPAASPGPGTSGQLLLLASGQAQLLGQLLLHGPQRVFVGAAGGPVVALADAAGHDLLALELVHRVLLFLAVQILVGQVRAAQTGLAQPGHHHRPGHQPLGPLTSLLVMNVMDTSSLTVVVATLGPGGSNSEFPNFFQF